MVVLLSILCPPLVHSASARAADSALLQAEEDLLALGAQLRSQEILCRQLELELKSQEGTCALLEDRRLEIRLKTGTHSLLLIL